MADFDPVDPWDVAAGLVPASRRVRVAEQDGPGPDPTSGPGRHPVVLSSGRGRSSAALSALVLVVTGSLAVGVCLYRALATVRITDVGTVSDSFTWIAAGGAGLLVTFTGAVVAVVAAVSRRGTGLALGALLAAIVLPCLAAWIGISAGVHVLAATVGDSVAHLGDSATASALRQALRRWG